MLHVRAKAENGEWLTVDIDKPRFAKKIFAVILSVVMLFCLAACSNRSDKCMTKIGSSKKFTESEINNAFDLIKSKAFEDTVLLSLEYDEEKSNKALEDYKGSNSKAAKEISDENAMIVFSTFKVGHKNPVLNHGMTYTDYMWILVRESKKSDWQVYDAGY